MDNNRNQITSAATVAEAPKQADGDAKVLIATFANHYGAMLFKKAVGNRCSLRPVPRALSSSCGTCAVFDVPFCPEFVNENLEAVYEFSGGRYVLIYEN